MEKLVLGSSISYIGAEAFRSVSGGGNKGTVSLISLAIEPPTCVANAFDRNDLSKIFLYVPEESIEEYKTTYPWADFTNILPYDDNIDDEGAVEILTADKNGVYDVFNLNGVKIMTTIDENMLKELPEGVYIINGQKVKF